MTGYLFMTCNRFTKVIIPIVILQLLACLALFQVNEKIPVDSSDRIVVEYWNSMLLLTAKVSTVVSFLALSALVAIGLKRRL